jgi:hypothetical protein
MKRVPAFIIDKEIWNLFLSREKLFLPLWIDKYNLGSGDAYKYLSVPSGTFYKLCLVTHTRYSGVYISELLSYRRQHADGKPNTSKTPLTNVISLVFNIFQYKLTGTIIYDTGPGNRRRTNFPISFHFLYFVSKYGWREKKG